MIRGPSSVLLGRRQCIISLAAFVAACTNAARKRLLAAPMVKVQTALLDGTLDRTEAERLIGRATSQWKSGATMECDTAGTSFSGVTLKTRANGEVNDVDMVLRDPFVEDWSAFLDVVGRDAEENADTVAPGAAPSFTLRAHGRHPGIVMLDLDRELSTFTPGAFGARAPIRAAVTSVFVRRVDSYP